MKIIVSGYVGRKITGIGRCLIETINAVKDENIEFVVYTNKDMKSDMKYENSRVTMKYYNISRNNPIGNLFWVTCMLPIMAIKEKADEILICNFALLLFPVKKTIIYLHDMTEYHVKDKQTKFRMIYRKLFAIPISAKNATKIVTVSNSSKKDIMEILKIKEEKIALIYSGIKREKFNKMSIDDACLALGEKKIGNNFILYVGTMDHPGRNIINLVKSFENLQRENRYTGNLILVGGKGKGYEVIDEYIEKSEYKSKIIIPGYVTDLELQALYSLCDVFCYISLYEGFGLPPLEAIASGAKVVVSNTASLPEAVGDVGYKVNPHDVKEIENAIYEAVNKNVDDEYKDKVEKHLSKFSWNKAAEQLTRVIYEVKEDGK